MITCPLRSQPEGTPPPLSPVNTLRALKSLYSPLLLRLLSRTLAGGLSSAWGSAGGGGEGRVAVRAAQWETQWENQENEGDSEMWHVRSSPSPLSSPSETLSPKKCSSQLSYHFSKNTSNITSKNRSKIHDQFLPNPLDEGSPSNEVLVGMLSNGLKSVNDNLLREGTSLSLSQIVIVAADQVRERRGNLAEAIRTSPHRLIQHVVAAQKSHLSGTKI